MLQGMNILYENNSLVHYYFPIVQWGVGNGTEGSNPPWHNFPISFPDICYQVVTNRKDNGWGAVDGNSAGACNWNAKQVQIYSNDGTVPVNYVAIGK